MDIVLGRKAALQSENGGKGGERWDGKRMSWYIRRGDVRPSAVDEGHDDDPWVWFQLNANEAAPASPGSSQ